MKSILALAAVGFLFLSVLAVSDEVDGGEALQSDHKLTKRFKPTQLYHFPAANSTGTGVLVCPGGSYALVALGPEGFPAATLLNNINIDAWVLDYTTVMNATAPIYPITLEEPLDALSYIREQYSPDKLGIWGFSAGGHLAAVTLANPASRLDFGILTYPVITLEGNLTNAPSRDNLIGANASSELEREFSAQFLVSAETPPTFVFHTFDDDVVPVQNSLKFLDAMAAYNRSAQAMIIPDGPHGMSLALDDPKRSWTPELVRWLQYSV